MAGVALGPREVALEKRIAYVLAPHGQSLTLTFFQVAAANNCPACGARKHPPTCLDVIVNCRHANGQWMGPFDRDLCDPGPPSGIIP
jgi:hypothetical protein